MPVRPDYAELKAFFSFFVERFLRKADLPPELHPVAVLEAQEERAPARALAGLRMAVNDCMEMSSHWPPAQVAALDAELSACGSASGASTPR
jgi:hypothetical protein